MFATVLQSKRWPALRVFTVCRTRFEGRRCRVTKKPATPFTPTVRREPATRCLYRRLKRGCDLNDSKAVLFNREEVRRSASTLLRGNLASVPIGRLPSRSRRRLPARLLGISASSVLFAALLLRARHYRCQRAARCRVVAPFSRPRSSGSRAGVEISGEPVHLAETVMQDAA